MLSGSYSEESDEDDGPKYPDAGELIFQTKSVDNLLDTQTSARLDTEDLRHTYTRLKAKRYWASRSAIHLPFSHELTR